MKHIIKVASLENLPETRPLVAMDRNNNLRWLADIIEYTTISKSYCDIKLINSTSLEEITIPADDGVGDLTYQIKAGQYTCANIIYSGSDRFPDFPLTIYSWVDGFPRTQEYVIENNNESFILLANKNYDIEPTENPK